MIIYLEKKVKDNSITKHILEKYEDKDIVLIDNYKNIFDKNFAWKIEKSIIIASVNNAILDAPAWYGHSWKGYFLKNSLNCVFDCKYCYLKWAFKNDIQVFFVNYDDMKEQILEKIKALRSFSHTPIWFYTSDYSDNLATDNLTLFTSEFFPFFSSLENVKAEIRTKSINISNILKQIPSKNIEIAFSLNPSEVIEKYELKTPLLDARIKAINTLLDAGWQVGIRFLPLLEIENYKEVYKDFLEYVVKKIDFNKIYSVFIGWLLYTKEDYNKMLKKEPYLDLLYKLEDSKDGFIREKREVRDYFYLLFDKYIKDQKCNRCLDN